MTILLTGSRAATTVTIPGSIADDCSEDVTGEIQSWVDDAPDGSTLQFGNNACYHAELPLLILERSGLTLDGNGSEMVQYTDGHDTSPPSNYFPAYNWPRNRSNITVSDSQNITIKDLTVRGPNSNGGPDGQYIAELEAQHAYNIIDSENTVLSNVEGYQVWGDFVYMSGGDGLTVRNGTFAQNGRQGLAIVDGSNLLFENNDMRQVRRSMIDFEANYAGANMQNLTFRNNLFGPARLNFLANGGADAVIENVLFNNNTLDGMAMKIHIVPPNKANPSDASSFKRRNYRFIDNDSNRQHGTNSERTIIVDSVLGFNFTGNNTVAQENRNMKLIELRRVRDAVMKNNSVIDAVGFAFYDDSSVVNVCEENNTIGPDGQQPDPDSGPTCPDPPPSDDGGGGSGGGDNTSPSTDDGTDTSNTGGGTGSGSSGNSYSYNDQDAGTRDEDGVTSENNSSKNEPAYGSGSSSGGQSSDQPGQPSPSDNSNALLIFITAFGGIALLTSGVYFLRRKRRLQSTLLSHTVGQNTLPSIHNNLSSPQDAQQQLYDSTPNQGPKPGTLFYPSSNRGTDQSPTQQDVKNKTT